MTDTLRPSRFRIFLLVFGFLGFVSGGEFLRAGGLQWEQSSISIKAQPGDKGAEASFAFTNTSANSVEVGKISTSCGCTTAELAKKVYQPGESGALKVVFTFGSRKGRQEKSIVVRAGDEKPDVLMLRVEIPDVVVVDPAELVWKVGDMGEKTFDVTVTDSAAVKVKAARALGKDFEAKLEEIDAGTRYRVPVRPLNAGRAVKGSVRLEVESPRPRTIYLRVGVEE